MHKVCYFIVLLFSVAGFSQEPEVETEDLKYREDQFYASVTYNFLDQKPNGVSQQGFSSGFHLGVIRDIPVNKSRTLAFGVGLGLSLNSYNQNLRVSKEAKDYVFSIINDTETPFTKNKYFTYVLEAPFEFRWRNSTSTSYKFWRIYSGFKLGYVFANQTKYIGQPDDIKLSSVDAFNKLQYGFTLSAGYNTWNVHLYYALNPIFNSDAKLENGETIGIKTIKIGLIFYIL